MDPALIALIQAYAKARDEKNGDPDNPELRMAFSKADYELGKAIEKNQVVIYNGHGYAKNPTQEVYAQIYSVLDFHSVVGAAT